MRKLGAERRVLTFLVRSCGFIKLRAISAIVDTGSPFTFISQSDLRGLRIPKNLPMVRQINLLIPLKIYSVGECEIWLKDENSKYVPFKTNLHIAVPAIQKIMIPGGMPSIVGTDFLDRYNMAVGKKYLLELNE
ncbi:MAG: hypothetical protein DRP03_02040 [Candidatus Aenigmatarchaeota archaeon]|nr:MAG: hypothetical protein DRP03_02040 [Candidatus Aenigmarchaeota archaeon]